MNPFSVCNPLSRVKVIEHLWAYTDKGFAIFNMTEDIFDLNSGADSFGGSSFDQPATPPSLPDIPQDTPSSTNDMD